MAINNLAAAAAPGPGFEMRSGVVKTSSPFVVTIDGTDIPMVSINSGGADVGDTVTCLRQAGTWLCIGPTSSSAPATWTNFDAGNLGAPGYGGGIQLLGSTTNPTLGNSHLYASFNAFGNTVDMKFKLLVGGTWSSGSGVYSLTVPFPIKLDADGNSGNVGQFWINDSGVSLRSGILMVASATTIQGLIGATNAQVASTTQTWNNPDSWSGSISYERA